MIDPYVCCVCGAEDVRGRHLGLKLYCRKKDCRRAYVIERYGYGILTVGAADSMKTAQGGDRPEEVS